MDHGSGDPTAGSESQQRQRRRAGDRGMKGELLVALLAGFGVLRAGGGGVSPLFPRHTSAGVDRHYCAMGWRSEGVTADKDAGGSSHMQGMLQGVKGGSGWIHLDQTLPSGMRLTRLRGGWDEEERIKRKRKKEREVEEADYSKGVMAVRDTPVFGFGQITRFEERETSVAEPVAKKRAGRSDLKNKPMWMLAAEMQAKASRMRMVEQGIDPYEAAKEEEERKRKIEVKAARVGSYGGGVEEGREEGLGQKIQQMVSEAEAKAQPTGEVRPLVLSKKDGAEVEAQAKNGNATAQLLLGLCHSYGTGGMPRSPHTAAQWFEQSSYHGNARAMFSLGVMSETGFGKEADDAGALKWYCRAAKKGYTNAAWNAANMYFEGRGTNKNETAGQAYMTLAAKGDHVNAQLRLALWHMKCAKEERSMMRGFSLEKWGQKQSPVQGKGEGEKEVEEEGRQEGEGGEEEEEGLGADEEPSFPHESQEWDLDGDDKDEEGGKKKMGKEKKRVDAMEREEIKGDKKGGGRGKQEDEMVEMWDQVDKKDKTKSEDEEDDPNRGKDGDVGPLSGGGGPEATTSRVESFYAHGESPGRWRYFPEPDDEDEDKDKPRMSNEELARDHEAKALKWYRRAAKLGHPWGMTQTADCYMRGIGASASEEKAAKWLQEVQNRLGAEEIDAKYDEILYEGQMHLLNFSSPLLEWGAERSGIDINKDDIPSFESSDDHHLIDSLKIDDWWKNKEEADQDLSHADVPGYNDYPGVGYEQRGTERSLKYATMAFTLGEDPPVDVVDADLGADTYGLTREERIDKWWDDLEKKQYQTLMAEEQVPAHLNDFGRGKIVTPGMLKELLYKFENWDDIVDKRSLLKYEELRGEKEKAKVRRFAGIGQVIDEGQSTVKKASQIYGMGHGLKGWFGEDVAQR